MPRDPVAWAALAVAVVALIVAVWRAERVGRWATKHPRQSLALLATCAVGLSWGYLVFYLRGGPRIIDATSYWLEARALARGYFAFPVLEPSGSFRGRFLLTPPGASSLAVLFPPGYPALLALGFLAGAPLAVGPIIGGLLVVATYALARALFDRQDIALTAAGLSVLCAALRYHSADTMSHGWAALLLTVALVAALRGGLGAPLAGLALGWLVATRPATGLVGLIFVAAILRRQGRAALVGLVLGTLPGLGLLAFHQHAATGSWLGSTQLRYYALADGPPGCFRYGFGSGIGCRFEHGDFVQAHLGRGYDAGAALGTTGRRLWMHMGDVLNAWPLFAILPWVVVRGRNEHGVRLGSFLVVALVAAYAPFYFDGNYPGGGARFFAEALPMEHVLVAWGLAHLRIQRFAPATLLVAFALHRSRDHDALRDREGGRPMFEPAVLARAGVTHGLLFTNTDHGFDLAHVPGASDPSRELVVARWRSDGHDASLWQSLGKPAAYRYVYSVSGAPPSVVPFQPGPDPTLSGGAEWPPLAVAGGWAHPEYPGAACAGGRYGLRLHGAAEVTLDLPSASRQRVRVTSHWVAVADGPAEVELRVGTARWQAAWQAKAGECRPTPGPEIWLDAGGNELWLRSSGIELVLDQLEARPTSTPPAAVPDGK